MSRAKPTGARILPKKQTADHEHFAEAWKHIGSLVSREELDDLVERTVADIRTVTRGKRVAFAWSGGKDSQAIELVCKLAGIDDCVMAISDLEWPEFFRWVTDHMPPGLEVIHQRDVNLDWLAANPHVLFPQTAALAGEWFKRIQWPAQTEYYKRMGLDMIILGRRRADGNFMGRDGSGIYTNGAGITRYCPVMHWRHVDVLACCHYYKMELAPIYDWPRGFRVGTHSWPARQWCRDSDHGFEECWTIDPDVIRAAAVKLPQARDWMQRTGRT